MQALEFIYKRRSVRKFKDTDKPIPKEHLEQIITAAAAAPSGKNLQNWHFVVVTNKDKIQEIANIIVKKNAELAECLSDPDQIKAFKNSLPAHTFFKKAPALVIIYAGPYPVVADQFLAAGIMDTEKALELKNPNPGIQNIGAAIENLLLVAAHLGYGTCWMTGPTYAFEEISAYIEFDKIVGKKDYYLAAMTPLGIPANEQDLKPVPSKRKPLDEVLTVLE